MGFAADVGDQESLGRALEGIRRAFPEQIDGGRVGAAVYNVGSKFVRKPFLEMGVGEFEEGIRANA